jgi:hypothetical protein
MTMTEQQPTQGASLIVRDDQPLIGIILPEDGQEVTHYFTDETAATATTAPQRQRIIQEALSIIGAWSDLDWDEMVESLDRIRHESKPTPPIDLDV